MPKNPVHGTGSSHDPRSPSQTHDRNFGNWGHRTWNSRYGCEYCWSEVDGCYFYFYAPAGCYYPVSSIEHFRPVREPVAPVTVADEVFAGDPRFHQSTATTVADQKGLVRK